MSVVLQRALQFIARLPTLLLIGLVRFYQVAIGPWLPPSCRFTPSCSTYALQALRKYGALKGGVLAVWRVLRCNPFGAHGYDPPRWFGERLPEEPPACGCTVEAAEHQPTLQTSTAEGGPVTRSPAGA